MSGIPSTVVTQPDPALVTPQPSDRPQCLWPCYFCLSEPPSLFAGAHGAALGVCLVSTEHCCGRTKDVGVPAAVGRHSGFVVNTELKSFGCQRSGSSFWVHCTDLAEPFVALTVLSFQGLKIAVRRTGSSLDDAENERAEECVCR